jgi:ACS family hexuronate transporter-like MFS transporter
MKPAATDGNSWWVWWVCGLLLLASTINYMDRQTLSNTSVQITREFRLNDEQYGQLELAFGLAFACGATLFGIVADRTNIRWLYPAVLLAWSAMGFATGWVTTFAGLLWCRMLLGLFEAGHWPCALRTTQRLLPPDKRTLGNSVLQSGTAIGAVATPILIRWTVTDEPGSWRPVFQMVGALGVGWVVLWLVTVRTSSLAPQRIDTKAAPGKAGAVDGQTFAQVVFSRRFAILVVVVICINLCWHQFRVWMPKFLETGRGFSKAAALDINAWFNVMTDIGCIAAGVATALLFRRGATVFGARTLVFAACATLVAAGSTIPWIPAGPRLVAVLMVVGLGSLGLFPCYYAFSQDLSTAHQGKVTGLLGTCAWIVPSIWHWQFGRYVDQSKSYDMGMMIASLMPLVALAAILLLWPRDRE